MLGHHELLGPSPISEALLNISTELLINDAEDMVGSEAIVIDFKTNSDNCWFNFRDNDDQGPKGRGANSVVFSLRSEPRDEQTVWKVSQEDKDRLEEEKKKKKEEEDKKNQQKEDDKDKDKDASTKSAATSSAKQTTTTASSTSVPASTSTSTLTLPNDNAEEVAADADKDEGKGTGLSTRAKIAIIACTVLGLMGLATAVVAWWIARRRRLAKQGPSPLIREAELEKKLEPEIKDPHLTGYYGKPTDGSSSYGGYGASDGRSVEMDTMSVAASTVPTMVEAQGYVPSELPTRSSHMPHSQASHTRTSHAQTSRTQSSYQAQELPG